MQTSEREELIVEARELLPRFGVDTSRMSDDEVVEAVGQTWERIRQGLERFAEAVREAMTRTLGIEPGGVGEVRPEREWWEQVVLAHVKAHAMNWAKYEDAIRGEGKRFRMGFRYHQWIVQNRMQALGTLLNSLRKASRRWALKEVRRVSAELGLYEEDDKGALRGEHDT